MPMPRDWAGLPELPLAEVLGRLLPCLRSIYAFAATCGPWRRLLRAVAADLLRPRLPPLLLVAVGTYYHVTPFSPQVVPPPLPPHPLPPADATLLSASRGHLILRRRRAGLLVLSDAFTGADAGALRLPSPHFAYHCAALSRSHLLLFHSKHAFFSLPFPGPNPSSSSGPNWTKHRLPRAASFVTAVLEFRGRVLGLTDRAQLLEFNLGGGTPKQTVRILPAAGLPDATTFDRWHLGPHLAAAGDRLLLVLFMLKPKSVGWMPSTTIMVKKVAVYGLDMARMRWEEVDTMAPYSLFVDCAGKSAAACLDAGNCGMEENRVFVAAPGCGAWRTFPPGWEAPHGGASEVFTRAAMELPRWPSQIWVYPQLFF